MYQEDVDGSVLAQLKTMLKLNLSTTNQSVHQLSTIMGDVAYAIVIMIGSAIEQCIVMELHSCLHIRHCHQLTMYSDSQMCSSVEYVVKFLLAKSCMLSTNCKWLIFNCIVISWIHHAIAQLTCKFNQLEMLSPAQVSAIRWWTIHQNDRNAIQRYCLVIDSHPVFVADYLGDTRMYWNHCFLSAKRLAWPEVLSLERHEAPLSFVKHW